MTLFNVKLIQFVEETCIIEVEAESADAARAEVQDSIKRNMVDEEYDWLDWEDGDGTHHDGITIDEVAPKAS